MDYICKQFQKAIEKRDKANMIKTKKLARLDPALRLHRDFLKKFDQVKAISFNLKDTLTFKKEYKMIARESSMTALIKKCSDQFAERDQNIGQAL